MTLFEANIDKEKNSQTHPSHARGIPSFQGRISDFHMADLDRLIHAREYKLFPELGRTLLKVVMHDLSYPDAVR